MGAALVGLLLGGVTALALQTPAVTPSPTSVTTPVPPSEPVLLAWSSGGLPEGFAERAAADRHVARLTVVSGGLLELSQTWDADGRPVDAPGDGMVIPLDALGVEPGTYAEFLPASSRAAFAELGPDEALLGVTSARLRRLGPGSVMRLADGSQVRVAGVVDDALVAGAEVVVPAERLAQEERYLLVGYEGDRAAVEEALRALAVGTTLRIRGPGETPFLRHGDAVLPQALIKERFGEFAYRRTTDRDVELQAGWAEEHTLTAELPLLGPVRCHRDLLPALTGAMAEVAKRNLGHLVDPDDFTGCYSPRLTNTQDSVSRHAWGIAVDLGASAPEVVAVMQAWGFTWGGEWLAADPGHFEYVGEPSRPERRQHS